jgi:hypothetical protein
MPSSTRLFKWLDIDGHRRMPPRLGLYLNKPNPPMVTRGVQSIEITPDLNSGAYYGYDCVYLMLMFTYQRRRYIVVVSKQDSPSTVGKKGYVLGTDDDWDYFYSGKKGLTIPALGWVRSYMYSSSGINIYHELDPGLPKIRCAMFKWLRAGWSGINMVQRKHIDKGLKRFAKPFKKILEHPSLPPAAALISDFSQMRRFSDDELRSKMQIYANILKKRYPKDNQGRKKWPADILENKSHWTKMSREEMQSVLVIEHMKLVLGKTPAPQVRALLDLAK